MVKEKPNSTRIYDEEGFRRRAACICVKSELEKENSERKHRTEVFVLVVTEELPEWEDAKNMGRKRKWFTVEDALEQLSLHKPVQLAYLQSLLNCRNKVT